MWTSSPTGRLEVRVSDPACHSPYAFGTKTAQFHVCSRCGVVPLVTSDIQGRTYAVVSVNALIGVDPALLAQAPASFGEEDVASRLARRTKGWIPSVSFSRGA